ncbi:MAG: hypothetical protein RIM72_19070 [Alphaproteobacteria bacterium]
MNTDLPDIDPGTRVARQERILTIPLPDAKVEFLCNLDGNVDAVGASLRLSYIPYKSVLDGDGFAAYLKDLPAPDDAPSAMETVAAVILDDLNNELVPRWLQLVLTRQRQDGTVQRVLVEDKQPRWDNKTLIGRAGGL